MKGPAGLTPSQGMHTYLPAGLAVKYKNFRTDLAEGVGEVAGVLFRVAKYAYEKVRTLGSTLC